MQTKLFQGNGWKSQTAYDLIEICVVEHLKEHYILCLDMDDVETATDILATLRYFTTYEEFKEFMKEVRDAGYTS